MAPQRRNIPISTRNTKSIKTMLTKMSKSFIKPIGSTECWSAEDMAKLNKEIRETNAIVRWMIRHTTQEKSLQKTNQDNQRSQPKNGWITKGSQRKRCSEWTMQTGRAKVEPVSMIPEDQKEETDDNKIRIATKSMLTRMSRKRIKPLGSTDCWSVDEIAKLNEEMEKTDSILMWMIGYSSRVKALKQERLNNKRSQWKKDQEEKGIQQETRLETKTMTELVKVEQKEEGDSNNIKIEPIMPSPKFSTASEDSDAPTSPPIVFGPQNFYSGEDEILLRTYGW